MAIIILGKTECSLCGGVLASSDDVVATTHFIADPKDPLWRYSDSGMHQRCFLEWKHRVTFVEKYNATIGQQTWGNGTRHRMQPDGTIKAEQVGPQSDVAR